jgi:membrane fusion protein, heavy metal efflux system
MFLPPKADRQVRRWIIAPSLVALVLAVVATWLPNARAHEGHDHGDKPAGAGAAPMSPRAIAVSETYQFVGIVEGEVLVIYLDRAADNAPVTTAEIEVSLDGQPFKAVPVKNGTFEITAPQLKKPGQYAVVATVTEGALSDLLVGSVTVGPAAANDNQTPGGLVSWARGLLAGSKAGASPDGANKAAPTVGRWLLPAVAVSALVLAGALGLRRRRTNHKDAALALAGFAAALWLIAPTAATAHDGHDHGPDLAASSGNTPARRPDGTIFLPKPSQRLLEVRTQVLKLETSTPAVRLAGRVVANPNFSGVVQGTLPGRYQAPPGGVPALGTRVKAGDILGRVAPSFASIDSSDMAQTLGDLEQKISIAQAKLARQEQLLRTNVVARAAVDETRLEVAGLVKRRTQILEARVRPEELTAPVDGVIAVARVVSGQVVAPSDKIFEIVDPARLLVEALVFDETNADLVGEATALAAGDTSVKLRFMGRSRALQQSYTLMQFEVMETSAALNVGTPVSVVARVGAPLSGIFVPKAALAQAPNGQMVVFEHREPEVFVPRQVRTQAFDAQTVIVSGGLEPGLKIVVRNAPLVNQVR